MNEKLLHFIWKFLLFEKADLRSTDGEPIEIIDRGMHNSNAGADFLNAKVKIGETLWAGNVEIHTHASDWFVHKHHMNAAYENVILHVVFQANERLATRTSGEEIATLQLCDKVDSDLLKRYEELQKQQAWIPCEKYFDVVDSFTLENYLVRLAAERMESKLGVIQKLLVQSEQDWENVIFQMIAKYLGASINKEPMFQLAQSLPVKMWARYADNPLQMEALVFGQAGFLEEKYEDEYPNLLRKEYLYLKRLHSLQPMQKEVWKFMRLRPSNFPTIRLAQLAAIMCKETKLFATIATGNSPNDWQSLFSVQTSSYWSLHFLFDKPTKRRDHRIGEDMKNVFVINAIAPVLFAYGKYKDDENLLSKSMELLENCKPENNGIIKGWSKLGITPKSASQTQALLHLHTEYCEKFRCLDCVVGCRILQKVSA